MTDLLEKKAETKKTPENKSDQIKEALLLLPTEFLCINPDIPFTDIDEDVDIRLRDLTSKVKQSLRKEAGLPIPFGEPEATSEESHEFANLLKIKGDRYSKFSLLLDSIADTKNDPDKYIVDTATLTKVTKVNIKEAVQLLPSELLCINPDVANTELSDTDLRLKELIPKVMRLVYSRDGQGVESGKQNAMTIEAEEFANLLREKGASYSKFASLLNSVARVSTDTEKYLIESVESPDKDFEQLEQQEQIKFTISKFMEDKFTQFYNYKKANPGKTSMVDFVKIMNGIWPMIPHKNKLCKIPGIEKELPDFTVALSYQNAYRQTDNRLYIKINPLLEAQTEEELNKALLKTLEAVYHETEHIYNFGTDVADESHESRIEYFCHPGEIEAHARQYAFLYMQKFPGEDFDLIKMRKIAEDCNKNNNGKPYYYFITFANPEKQTEYMKNNLDVKTAHEKIVEATKRHFLSLKKRSL